MARTRPKRTWPVKIMCLISPSFRRKVEATEEIVTYLKLRNRSQYGRR